MFISLEKQLTITAGAYAVNNVVGGLLTFESVPTPSAYLKIKGVTLTDRAGQAVRYDLVFFEDLPTGTFTDNAPLNPSNSDLLLINPIIPLLSTDNFQFSGKGVSSISNIFVPVRTVKKNARQTGRNLYAAVVTRGTPTFASTQDLFLKILAEA
jgi:hypothetical protein